jgi:hypothetical protein
VTRRAAATIAVAVLLLAVGAGCATRGLPRFAPATAVESARALETWADALRRAGSLQAARLLYDASARSGLVRVSGTLAVAQAADRVDAVLTGPFGAPLARYENGALRGERLRPIAVRPEELRALLAGVWTSGAPSVAGARAGKVLLRWESDGQRAEGVLDVAAGRLTLLRITRSEGELTARYSGPAAPWPEKIELEEGRTGNRLELSLIAREPL